MEDELFLRILQLDKEYKLKLLKAIEEDLSHEVEGYLLDQARLSIEQETEIRKRHKDISGEDLCVIEFEDHFIHLQKVCNAK